MTQIEKFKQAHPTSKLSRNKHIFELRRSGITLKTIAVMFGITQARVRCIADKMERTEKYRPEFFQSIEVVK